MNPKFKALLFNFIGFAVLFLGVRFSMGYLIPLNPIFLAVVSAIIANILAPKFGVIEKDQQRKIMMKWIFIKGIREI
jgi:hypothetical protein